MQLTRYTDYGLRTLMYVAMHQDRSELFKISEITEVFELSANHVSKVVHHLGKLGYLQTIRGKRGGFRLGMPAAEINIGKVVSQLENTLSPVDCYNPYCAINPACKLKHALARAVEAYMAVLYQYTLADVVSNHEALVSLLPSIDITTVSHD